MAPHPFAAQVRWAMEREHGLIVAAVHQAALVLPYVEELLRTVASRVADQLRQVRATH